MNLKQVIKILVIVAITLTLIGIIGLIWTANSNDDEGDEEVTQNSITIDMRNYSYSPDIFSAKRGETITVKLTNSEGTHNMIVEGLEGARSEIIGVNEETEFEFDIPNDSPDQYTFYSSVGRHRDLGMEGTINVVD